MTGPLQEQDTAMTILNQVFSSVGQMKDKIPMRRLADPSEIAKAAVFLLSPASGYITVRAFQSAICIVGTTLQVLLPFFRPSELMFILLTRLLVTLLSRASIFPLTAASPQSELEQSLILPLRFALAGCTGGMQSATLRFYSSSLAPFEEPASLAALAAVFNACLSQALICPIFSEPP